MFYKGFLDWHINRLVLLQTATAVIRMVTSFTQRSSTQESGTTRSRAAHAAPEQGPTLDQLNEFRLNIMKQLQATLDLEQILRSFFSELQRLVPLDGCHYQAENVGLVLDFGETGRHRCNYELCLNDEQFGRLGFSRSRRLQEKELQLLESVMDVLVYPMRNALLYRKALATAMIDPLTGLNNRGAMAVTLNREMDRMRRHDQDMSILMVDIDHFKDINDRYGHLAGDDVLRQVAQLIDTTIRGCDACFRFGGEEFLIMLTDSNLPLARMVAERLRHTISEQTRSPAPNAQVTISVGVAHFDDESDWPELVDRADRALYQAKQAGRNRVVTHYPDTTTVQAL